MDRIYLSLKLENPINSKKFVYTKKNTSKKKVKSLSKKKFRLGLPKCSFNHPKKYRAK